MKITISITTILLGVALAAPTNPGTYDKQPGNIDYPGVHPQNGSYPPPPPAPIPTSEYSSAKATPTPSPQYGDKGLPSPAYPGEKQCYTPPSKPDWTKPRVHTVLVGGDDLLRYDPAFVRALPGDTIRFEFLAKNHTLTQSSFDSPCTALGGGIASGFRPNPDNVCGKQTFEVKVADEKPMWFYCEQGNHCSVGMVFAVNPQREGKTYSAFLNNAVATFKPAPAPNASAPNASTPNASTPDALAPDTPAADASSTDASSTDAPVPDGGAPADQ